MKTYEWTDADGQRIVVSHMGGAFRVSVYGAPTMTNGAGAVVIGVDIPPHFLKVAADALGG